MIEGRGGRREIWLGHVAFRSMPTTERCFNWSSIGSLHRRKGVIDRSQYREDAMDDAIGLRERLATLMVEHCDLDDVIARMSEDPVTNQLQLQRLKKRKLLLKDQIACLRSQILPDIIA